MMDSSHVETISDPPIVAQVRDGSAFTRRRRISFFERLEALLLRFSPAERLLLYTFTIALGLSSFALLAGLNEAISIEIPARGGSFIEGETGSARFINPVLAISDADQDLSKLIYSGLMRAQPDGSYVPDLAQSYTISEDGTTYTFKLRSDATFHDGAPVSAADVLYTVALAQNPDIKSPHRADWEGVNVSSPDQFTVVFTLPHAYAPFMEDTTIGIMPKHLWQNVQPDSFPFNPLNTHPIGTGPYKVTNVRTDTTGAPTRYDLIPFDNSSLPGKYIGRISFAFYPGQDALIRAFAMGQIDAVAGVSPKSLDSFKRDDVATIIAPLPRVFGIFFNQNHNAALAETAVRQALELAIDKKALVDSALHGYGEVLSGPLPPGILGDTHPATVDGATTSSAVNTQFSPEDAKAALRKAGWSQATTSTGWVKNIPKTATAPASSQTLSLKLATADEPELVATANLVAEQWRTVGVDVDVQIYPLSDFNNTVLRPRNYDAILFGEVVSRSGDLFAFWHSGQRNDPGLNLALYANSKADALLSKARASSSKEERDSLYKEFVEIVKKDRPAIFLYSPDFIYIVPTKIRDIQIGALSSSAERFLNVNQWYSDTERVWTFFARSEKPIR